MTRARFVGVLSFAALGCRLDTADDRVDALADAWCRVQSRCDSACGTVAIDHDLCMLQWTSQFEGSATAGETFDLAFSSMCLDRVLTALDELSCDELEAPWAWAERVCPVWHGDADEGDVCNPYELPENYAFVSACRPGLTCAPDPVDGTDAWSCRDLAMDPSEGAGCLRYQGASVFEERCGAGLRCDAGMCVTGPMPGEPCECGGLFGCEGCIDGWCDAELGEDAGTCQSFVDVGDPCTGTQSECEYLCDPSTMTCIAHDDPKPLACALSLQL